MLDDPNNTIELLDSLCPLHLCVGRDGRIVHLGPTLQRLWPDCLGADFFEVFEVKKPITLQGGCDMADLFGQTLRLCAKADGQGLTGVAAPLGDGVVVNLSFGFQSIQAVQRYGLTIADFAPTDQTLAMLYMSEAKAMAIGEYKRLSYRLNGAKQRAEVAANTDALTGLLNLRALRDELRLIQRAQDDFALMTIDLDHFKAVNDTLGHAAGDHVLQQAARILQQEVRATDIVARNGGDEFTVLLKGVVDRATALEIGDRIIEQLEQPMPFGDAVCHISASVGTIFSADFPATDIATIMANADKALYGSKRAGRGRNTVYAVA